MSSLNSNIRCHRSPSKKSCLQVQKRNQTSSFKNVRIISTSLAYQRSASFIETARASLCAASELPRVSSGGLHQSSSVPNDLFSAVINNDMEMIHFLLNSHLNNSESISSKLLSTQADGCNSLWLACACGDVAVVKLLIQIAATLDTEHRNNHSTVLQIMLSQSSTSGVCPLWVSAEKGYAEICEILLLAGAEVDSSDWRDRTPLWAAACKGHCGVIHLLCDFGANVDFQSEPDGWSPLHAASNAGIVESVRQLLEWSADERILDSHDWSPLFLACYSKNAAVVSLFLENRLYDQDDVLRLDSDGWSILSIAARGGCANVVKILLDYGISANFEDCDGWTALHAASILGNIEVAETLCHFDANVNAEDICYRTPLFVSLCCGAEHSHFVAFLISKGADVSLHTDVRNTEEDFLLDGRSAWDVLIGRPPLYLKPQENEAIVVSPQWKLIQAVIQSFGLHDKNNSFQCLPLCLRLGFNKECNLAGMSLLDKESLTQVDGLDYGCLIHSDLRMLFTIFGIHFESCFI